jgi:hypothetical protein
MCVVLCVTLLYSLSVFFQNKNAKAKVLEPSSIPPPNVIEGKKKQKSEVTIASLDSKKIADILTLGER